MSKKDNIHPLFRTIAALNTAKHECASEILDHHGSLGDHNDHAWRAIDRLMQRLAKNKFKPYK